MRDSYPAPYPHDPPREVFEDLLFVHGSIRMGPGITIRRNMVVVRHGGEATALNPVRLDSEGERILERFAPITNVVRLGAFHGLDDVYTKERFGARFWCQPGSDDYPEPEPDVLIEEGTKPPIPDAEFFIFRQSRMPECALLLRRHGGILITCDSLQHYANTAGCSLVAKVALRVLGFTRPAQIGPPWRKRNTPPGGSLRPDFDRLLQLPFEHLIAAHGDPIVGGAREAVRGAVERFYGR